MNNFEQINFELQQLLDRDPAEAVNLHEERERTGWRVLAGYMPFDDDRDHAFSEMHAIVTRQERLPMPVGSQCEIDTYTLSLPSSITNPLGRIIVGIALWESELSSQQG